MQSRNELFKLFLGIMLVFKWHLIYITVVAILLVVLHIVADFFIRVPPPLIFIASIVFYSTYCIGIVQLFYVIPNLFQLRRRQEWELFKGVIIGAVITALLNGSCWLLVTSQ